MTDIDVIDMDDPQRAEWEAFVASCHAKGLCEFSGMRVTACQRSICDCFETPEGAIAIEVAAGIRRFIRDAEGDEN